MRPQAGCLACAGKEAPPGSRCDLQRRVWATYVLGQEVRKDPTREYLDVHVAAVRAVAAREGR